jgi:hypothetical protein
MGLNDILCWVDDAGRRKGPNGIAGAGQESCVTSVQIVVDLGLC